MHKASKIYISGHEGMVGSLLLKELLNRGYNSLVYRTYANLDLRDQHATFEFIKENKPEYVFVIAGKVGGIQANIKYPAEYLYDNLMIAANVIEAARRNNARKLLFLGSSCVYPRLSKQPMKEKYLLTGSLEPTNEGYAIAKIAGLKLCEYYREQYGCNFITVMPPNLYGPGDNFYTGDSHVISALLKKIHYAKERDAKDVIIWGTGRARREFLYNEDLVDGLIFLMDHYDESVHINIGSGIDVSIKDLAIMIKEIVGFKGELVWDKTKPDGMPKKLMDSSRIFQLNWQPNVDLFEGLTRTYKWFLENGEFEL